LITPASIHHHDCPSDRTRRVVRSRFRRVVLAKTNTRHITPRRTTGRRHTRKIAHPETV
jgi:hypothetical protein